MSAGPLTKQDGEPSSFKVLHMSLSFPSPLATPTVGIPPWDAVPASRPDGGKKKKTHFNRCLCGETQIRK